VTTAPARTVTISPSEFDAIVFDMDGVITDTARVHQAAWKRLFDGYLTAEAPADADRRPFLPDDYRRHVDGRARIDGVEAFLDARGVRLPRGTREDAPEEPTAWGLANRKNRYFQQALAAEGSHPFPSSLALAVAAHRAGMRTAVVTASRNRAGVLANAGADHLFDAHVDGVDAAELRLPGKPDPAPFLEAAHRLRVAPARAVVVEDALAGVAAGRAGGFGLVVGVDRTGSGSAEFLERGAHVVVADLAELTVVPWHQAPPPPTEWSLDYDGFRPDLEGRREALCTLGNGVLGSRGAAPEHDRDEAHYPGTYAAGFFNRLHSEVHGRTLEHESLVNLPNWLPLRIRIAGGAWLGTDDVELLEQRQRLSLRHGVLYRAFRFADSAGRRTTVSERRLVSMASANLAAIEWVVTPENWSGELVIRSEIDGSVENRNVADEWALAGKHLRVIQTGEVPPDTVWLTAETVQSHNRVAVAARTRVAPEATETGGSGGPVSERRLDQRGERVGQDLVLECAAGEAIIVEKVAALSTDDDHAISEPTLAALTALGDAGTFEHLLRDHVLAWEHLWRRCHLELGGDDVRTAGVLNLHVFHVLQTLSPQIVDRDVGVPARGVHGEAYRGHLFWDDLFIFPFLTLRLPDLTRELLLYRYRRLPAARRLAREDGHEGAMYPWQSGSDGREETPTQFFNPRSQRWMPDNSHRQRHVGLAVAYNVWSYHQTTGDRDFLAANGAEILVELARFFADLATFEPTDGRFHIRGVMGPDEFHDGYPDRPGEGVDDNAYTNVMVSWLLQRAIEAHDILVRDPTDDLWERLDLRPDELARWDHISRRLHVPFLDDGVLAQFAGYGDLLELDWEAYRRRYGNIGRLDLILEAEDDSTNRYRLSKQADVLMLFYLFSAEQLDDLFAHLGYEFDPSSIPRTIDHYLRRTSNGSTLSRVAHAWVLSRSDREQSWQVFREALASDVDDTQGGTTQEGVHLGAMAGTIDLVQRCYTGIEIRDDVLRFNPRLPTELPSLGFTIRYRGHWLDVAITATTLQLTARRSTAPPVRIGLDQGEIILPPGQTVTVQLDHQASDSVP
jgi:beta-phosphoglucomutase family hydrolase